VASQGEASHDQSDICSRRIPERHQLAGIAALSFADIAPPAAARNVPRAATARVLSRVASCRECLSTFGPAAKAGNARRRLCRGAAERVRLFVRPVLSLLLDRYFIVSSGIMNRGHHDRSKNYGRGTQEWTMWSCPRIPGGPNFSVGISTETF
jgi:hypothetical protein